MPLAEAAVRALLRARCSEQDINVFFNPAPGQHGASAIGGDEPADPESRGAASSTAKGAAIGAGLGLLAGSFGGPLAAAAGAAVGGYTGSLVGTLSGLGTAGKRQRRWPAGVMVAVNVGSVAPEPDVRRILGQAGAKPIQSLEGEWRRGEWRDFDPVSAPQQSGSPRNFPEIVYRIFPAGYGKWNVFEGDLGKLLSEFPDRQEAVDYATSLARTKKLAVVEIYRAGGVLESSRVYSASREQSAKALG